MKRIFITMSALLFSNMLLAKQSQNLGDKINSFFEPIVEVIGKVIFWDPISRRIDIVFNVKEEKHT